MHAIEKAWESEMENCAMEKFVKKPTKPNAKLTREKLITEVFEMIDIEYRIATAHMIWKNSKSMSFWSR